MDEQDNVQSSIKYKAYSQHIWFRFSDAYKAPYKAKLIENWNQQNDN